MPYIKNPGQRAEIDKHILTAVAKLSSEGDLNYAVSRLVDGWLSWRGVSYAELNRVIGVLECAKLELYRRIAAPYEDAKCRENGEVYDNAVEAGKHESA